MSVVTKLMMVSIATAAGAMVGLFFAKRLKRRASYFQALSELTRHLLTEVQFRRNPVKTILRDFIQIEETPLNRHLLEYLDTGDPKNLKLSRGCIKVSELVRVQKFLSTFGTLDSATQEGELSAQCAYFSQLASDAQAVREKHAAMYIKLGFFAGLAAGILFL